MARPRLPTPVPLLVWRPKLRPAPPAPDNHFIVAAQPQVILQLNLCVHLTLIPNYSFLPRNEEVEVDPNLVRHTALTIVGPIVDIRELGAGHLSITIENLFQGSDVVHAFLKVIPESGVMVDKGIGRALTARLETLILMAELEGCEVHDLNRRNPANRGPQVRYTAEDLTPRPALRPLQPEAQKGNPHAAPVWPPRHR
ncbi:uncharacterized protein TRAVEDRAFT_20277 [Trametes versicolor FP-101664 SS1]|uniref:uncharacterized protein n=1 Tax=Trametes versicolor (strain FP-101664) TaxID=717944 RepID=UPI00046230D6|nr:uncharacterized protein TRAVEDRAFT_20277 [Trametes versicolor FP-101664 SS1]EIW58185.1 hypothetical protein TRAVEDRAFT_20277 [Trametes versicolor FP-101664 SS1]